MCFVAGKVRKRMWKGKHAKWEKGRDRYGYMVLNKQKSSC